MWTRSHIKVFEGVLGVTVNGQSTLVGAGKMMDTATASVEKFDKEATDAMDHWAKRRAELIAMANASSAKQVHDYGCSPNSNFAAINGVGANSPCSNPCNSWRYNPWYGLITYIPCGANIYSPYGYRYWSPYNVMRAYYVPPPPCTTRGGGGFGGGGGVYTGMSQTSSGYSGAMSAPAAVRFRPRRRRCRPVRAPRRRRVALRAATARPAAAADTSNSGFRFRKYGLFPTGDRP